MANNVTNRIKIVLIEKGKSSRWLASELGKNASTVSRWCTNRSQPPIETLSRIASLLNVDIRELLQPTKKESY